MGTGAGPPQHPVGAVAYAGFAQRAVEDHPEAVGLRVGVLKIVRGTFRPHGMGGRGAFAGFVNFTDRFLEEPPNFCSYAELTGGDFFPV